MPARALIVATRNRHKVEEIAAILGPESLCLTLDEAPGSPHPIEDSITFEGNAAKKAVTLAGWLAAHATAPFWEKVAGLPAFVLADDSGLEVDALEGAPGIHSARFAALDTGMPGNSSDAENNAKLTTLHNRGLEHATARFRCALALVPVSPGSTVADLKKSTRTFSAACEGHISPKPRGLEGFGYDPLFVPQGHDESFAELGGIVKQRVSHRAKALDKLKAVIESH
jgi:XTP/dITP diphosphohydrolase